MSSYKIVSMQSMDSTLREILNPSDDSAPQEVAFAELLRTSNVGLGPNTQLDFHPLLFWVLNTMNETIWDTFADYCNRVATPIDTNTMKNTLSKTEIKALAKQYRALISGDNSSLQNNEDGHEALAMEIMKAITQFNNSLTDLNSH